MEGRHRGTSSAVKLLMREAHELVEPTDQYFAQPLEDNLFEWHFTIRGKASSDMHNGIYHGHIICPADYPLQPPSIVWLSPNCCFETNRTIRLSLSDHPYKSQPPPWSIRKILLAIIGSISAHTDQSARSADYTPEEQKAIAEKNRDWTCPACGDISEILLDTTSECSHTLKEAKVFAKQISFQVDEPGNPDILCSVKSPVTSISPPGTFKTASGTTPGSLKCELPMPKTLCNHPQDYASPSPIRGRPHPPSRQASVSDPPGAACFSGVDSSPTTHPLQLETSSVAYTRLVSANSSASPTKSLDNSNQLSPTTASVPDIPQPSPTQTPKNLPNSIMHSPVNVSMFRDILAKVKRIASNEHNQINAHSEVTIENLQNYVASADMSNKLAFSYVNSSVSCVAKSYTPAELDICNTNIEESMSNQLEPEPGSSAVDNESLQYIPGSKAKEVVCDSAELEPRSSPVDAGIYFNQVLETKKRRKTVSEKDEQNGANDPDHVSFSKVGQRCTALESLTSGFDVEEALQRENNPQEVPRIALKNKNGFMDSDSSVSAQQKESVSEQTGMEISRSELPADVENSELRIRELEISETEPRPNFDRSFGSSVPDLARRQNQGLAKGLHQRQSAPITRLPINITEDDQAPTEHTSSWGTLQRIEAISGDELLWNQPQFHRRAVHTILDQHNIRINDAHVQRVTRAGRSRSRSLCSASFIIMVGLCLITIFVLLNRFYFQIDISNLYR